MQDMMLDLETLGNNNNSVIVQIGACLFDRSTGEIGKTFSKCIDIEDAMKYGKVDGSTIKWWLGQKKEAQESVFYPKKSFPLKTVLKGLTRVEPKPKAVWCHATFDWVILKSAYDACGIKFPFHYRSARDLRTLTDLADVNPYKYRTNAIAHNALDDCKNQVKYTVDCFKKFK